MQKHDSFLTSNIPGTPEVCFGILAHTNTQALRSLLGSLVDHRVIIHLDRGVDRKNYLDSLGEVSSNTKFVSLENSCFVNWGGISVVDAEVAIIREYLKICSDNSFLAILSGECFPVRPVSEFCTEVASQKSNFICTMKKIGENSNFYEKRLTMRYTNFWFRDLGLFLTVKNRKSSRYRFRNLIIKIMQNTCSIFRINRKLKATVAVGSQWIVGHVVFFRTALELYPEFRDEFRNTLAPDEMLFQSMFYRMNEHADESQISLDENPVVNAKFHLIHNSLDYKWNTSDVELIRKSKKYLVRKMSPDLLKMFI